MGRPAVVSNHFSSGWISPAIGARADLPERMNGLLDAENVVIPPQGGVKKRPCLSVVARAEGAERIFGWHRNEREKFVVAIGEDGVGRVYSAGALDIPQPNIAGTLDFSDATRLNAFHYADTLILTSPDKPPQEIVLQDRDALIMRDDLTEFIAQFTGSEIGDVTITIGTATVTIPRPTTTEYRAEYEATFRDGVILTGFGDWDYRISFANSSALFAGRDARGTGEVPINLRLTGTQERRQTQDPLPYTETIRNGSNALFLTVSAIAGGFRVALCLATAYDREAITITADIDGVDQSKYYEVDEQANTILPANGFEARKMTIINPPVIRLSDEEYDKAAVRIEGGYKVGRTRIENEGEENERKIPEFWTGMAWTATEADAKEYKTEAEATTAANAATAEGGDGAVLPLKYCVKIPEPTSVGDTPANKGRTLTFDGEKLTSAEPGKTDLGLPPGNWCMAWNRRDGWPVAAGFRNGRLIFAGSNGNPASLWFSTIGNGRNFTQATAAPVPKNDDVPADLDGSEVNADFGMVRVLDSFERVTTLFSDNAFVLFTEGGEWTIEGAFAADDETSALARKYSQYGSAQNVGVDAVDQLIFFTARQAAFALQFKGDDYGYEPINITALRNENAFAGRQVVRVGAAQPTDLDGANVALFLLGGEKPAGAPDIAAFFINRWTQHSAWAKWTFPRHRILDMVVVDDDIFLLADELDEAGEVARRVVARMDAERATMTGEAGDAVSEGVAPFPVVLRTPDILNPYQQDGAWIYPKSLVRATLTAEAATESPASDIIKLSVCAGSRVIRAFQFPRFEGEGVWGRRAVDCHGFDSGAIRLQRGEFCVRLEQNDANPLHLLRLDLDIEAEPKRN